VWAGREDGGRTTTGAYRHAPHRRRVEPRPVPWRTSGSWTRNDQCRSRTRRVPRRHRAAPESAVVAGPVSAGDPRANKYSLLSEVLAPRPLTRSGRAASGRRPGKTRATQVIFRSDRQPAGGGSMPGTGTALINGREARTHFNVRSTESATRSIHGRASLGMARRRVLDGISLEGGELRDG